MGKYALFRDAREGCGTGKDRKIFKKILFFFGDWVIASGFPMIFRFFGSSSKT
jgi:hypothetical protein